MSNTIAWYNPETDVIVLQDFESGKEFVHEYDWDYINDTETLNEAIQRMLDLMRQRGSRLLLYGSEYNPLEHGLWVRLGEV